MCTSKFPHVALSLTISIGSVPNRGAFPTTSVSDVVLLGENTIFWSPSQFFFFCRRQVYLYTCDKLLHMPRISTLRIWCCIAGPVGTRIASLVVFLVLLIPAHLSRMYLLT